MTPDEHKARHLEIHEAFDELLADYFRWNREKKPSTTTVRELMEWSFEQTNEPTGEPGDSAHTYAVCAHCRQMVTDPKTHTCAEMMEHERYCGLRRGR